MRIPGGYAAVLTALVCLGCSSGGGGAPDAPSGLSASMDGTFVKLVWTPIPAGVVDFYEVEGHLPDSPFQIIDVVDGTENAITVGTDPTLPDGTSLSFRVRAVRDGARSGYSSEASAISVKPLVALSARPDPGGLVAADGFAADFVFNKEIDGATVAASFADTSGKPLPTTVSVGADGRSVHLALGVPLESAGQVSAQVQASDRKGQRTSISGGPWFAFTLSVFQNQQFDILPTNGTIALALPQPIGPAVPQKATLFAGTIPIAELGPAPWGTILWDTRTVPEGLYPLSVRIPGFVDNGTWSQGPRVLVDRTPAHLKCTPALGQADQVGINESIHLVADEEILNAKPALLVDGVEQPTFASPQGQFPTDLSFDFGTQSPPAPYVKSVSIGANAHDVAGNPVLLDGCTFSVRPWLEPWGPTLASTQGPVVASSLVLDALPSFSRTLSVAFIPPAGAAGEGRLMAASFSPAALDTPAPMSGPGTTVSSISLARNLLAWTERAGSGPGSLMIAQRQNGPWVLDPASPLNVDRSHDANHVAVAAAESVFFATLDRAVAWSEDDGAGGRALHASFLQFQGWTPVGMDVGASPGGIADFPTFTANGPAIDAGSETFLSFLDTAPGGVPQVRTSKGTLNLVGPTFVPMDRTLNADPSSPASEPSAFAFAGAVVAWVEGGKVLARSADFDFPIFSAPVVLNADPTHAARSPLVSSGKTVVFLEAGANGDEIQVRRWDHGAWIDLGVVNAGDAGPVTALAVAPGQLVGWADATGAVHVRQGNF